MHKKKAAAERRQIKHSWWQWTGGALLSITLTYIVIKYSTNPPIVHLSCARDYDRPKSLAHEYTTAFVFNGQVVVVKNAGADNGMITIYGENLVPLTMHPGFLRCRLHNSGGKAAESV